MATWRLLSPHGPVNLLCTRTLATIKNVGSTVKLDSEKNILPSKPKKPLNPYLLYFQSVKNKLQQEHPDIKYKELVKKASEEWVKVDPTIKQQFQKQHDNEYAIYKQKLDDYNNSITVEQKILMIEELMKKKSTLGKNQVKQILVELGKPKRPLSAYFIFLQNKQNNKDSTISHKEWIKNSSHEWNNMTTEDKEKYYIKAKQLQEKYNIELKKWEENMIQTGHSNLDSECPNQSNVKTTESITADFSNTKVQNKDNIKIGWGTDTTNSTSDVPRANNVLEQQHESTRSFTLYNDRNDLQVSTKYSRNEMKDMLINNNKSVQNYIHVRMYTYFTSVWKRLLLVLKKINDKNRQMKNTNTNGLS